MRTALLALAVAAGIYAILVLALVALGRGTTARELAALVPNLVRLFRALMRDPRVPRRSKVLLAGAALWLASPIDLIPEFIPVLGPLDDAVVAALALRHVIQTAGREVVAEHWSGAGTTLDALLRFAGVRA